MGSSASKPVVEASNRVAGSGITASTDKAHSSQPTPPPPPQVNVSADVDATSKSISTGSSSNESKCPMHRADGTYSYDWRALLFQSSSSSSFPHGPGGQKPLTEEEARANITRRLSCMDATMASPGIGCPIKEQETIIQVVPSSSKVMHSSSGGGGCPVKQGGQQHQQQLQEYNVYAQPIDPKNNMPQEANQLPAPGQTKPLSTDRVQSTIPKGGTSPESTTTTTWTYPSPQMFYNALARKGKLNDTDETDIASVVALHNNMNEKTWQKVLEWEAVLNPSPSPTPTPNPTTDNTGSNNSNANTPKLLKFTGRPTDLSPKAWFKHYILGHPLPFDRHDWTVLRSPGNDQTAGATVRYVIDYYYDETRAQQDAASSMPNVNDTQATPSLLIDVRPALDGPTQLWNRVVTMPLARHVAQSTPFEPLPMLPTRAMKSQVSESISVWQSIQLAAAGSKTREEEQPSGDKQASPDIHHAFKNIPPLSDKEAIEVATNLARALKECRQAQAAIDNLRNLNDDDDDDSFEQEYAKASMDLTICLGKILCPLQHSALTKATRGDNENQMEAALTSLNDCVLLKTTQHEISRRKNKQP